MPSTDAPNWWADVQQEREDMTGRGGRRPADDWLGEDIDFVPRRRMTRDAAPLEDRLSTATSSDDAELALHGVFVPAAGAAATRTVELIADDDDAPRRRRTTATVAATASSRTIELLSDDAPVERPVPADVVAHELAHLSAADDPFATPPPPAGVRRTIQIKGRPTEAGRLATAAERSKAQRHRGRTTSDRIGHRPDRIALWAVALGAVLILLAAMTSSSQAATRATKTVAPAATAKVIHVSPHALRSSTVQLRLRR